MPVVEYEKLDPAQAAAEEQKAQVLVQDDRQTLEAARNAMKSAQAEWDAAKFAKENTDPTKLSEAESRFTQAASKLERAKAQLKAAEDRLKTADQLLAEAEAEKARVAKLLARQEANRKALIGNWTRPGSNGTYRLLLKADGSGLMEIDFNATTKFLLRTGKLEIDIKWEIVHGDHAIFDSLQGRPEAAFKTVSGIKGTHRDEVLMQVEENSFTTHDAADKSKIKTWTRIREE